MSKKISLCFALASMLSLPSMVEAQDPAKYITWDGGEKFHTAYQNWTPGQPLYRGTQALEDDNFFISRVRCRTRFINRQTQAVETITNETEKKLLNWVPIGTGKDGNPNALPSGIFDSDVFSMWNMITHYGNWTAPLIRVPGAFADAAHKNGVSVSALSSVPWAATITEFDGGHGSNLAAIARGGGEKLVKFLKHYGVDGWGINSEFSWDASLQNALFQTMGDAYAYANGAASYPSYSMVWYTLMDNRGQLAAADGLTQNNIHWFQKDGRPTSNYAFGNYNWGSSQLSNNKVLAEGVGRQSQDVYAGMNMQGAQGTFWTTLKDYPTSIGLWGAHNMNMFFESRNEKGSAPEVQQATYLQRTERFFGNGQQNPIKRNEIRNGLTVSVDGLQNFHGVSAFISAKSVLQWNLDEMPFYSFFNMGNGKFFNINGEKAYAGEWYNIGMQDYLPTWRYWFATSYLGKTAADQGLSATFTWDDAWFGGSSLQISGSNAGEEFFHLFKTQFALKEGDKIRIRLKVVNGSTNIALVGSALNQETQAVTHNIFKKEDIDLGEWQEIVVPVSSGFTGFRMANKTLAAVALKFTNAQNLDLRLGEFSIIRKAVEKPATPIIKTEYTKAYGYSYKGIDGKIVFEMPRPAGMAAEEHIYNDDVKTSFFKIYSQQTNGEVKFVGATTSWAALCFAAPFDANGANTVRFGVSAVGLDGVTEGDIAWSGDLAAGSLSISETILVDKATIKPNESFTVSFEDPNHAAAKWEILGSNNNPIHTVENAKSITYQLADQGIYHVRVTGADGQAKTITGLIQVSRTEVGAVPHIETLTFNGQTTGSASANNVNALAYTGRQANGTVSRGLNLQESPLGIGAGEVLGSDVSGQPAYTLAFWIKFNSLAAAEDGIHLLNIREPNATWPQNNWGHLWSQYAPATGVYELTLRGASTHWKNRYEGVEFKVGVWTHIAYVFEKSADGNRTIPKLYINGQYVPSTKYGRESNPSSVGENVNGFSNLNSLRPGYVIMFGGAAHKRAGVDGVLDDVKFYNRALTASEVATQMYSTTPFSDAATKDALKGFWDFEGEPDAQNYFLSAQTNKKLAVGELKDNTSAGEGRRQFVPLAPAYEAGSPFLSGTSFRVTTTAKWDFPKGQISEARGTDTAGSAKVTYTKQGTYKGTLTLSNSWGSDSRTIEAINITSIEGMTDEISLQAFPNPFVETVYVRFAEAGTYELAIYDLSGGVVSREVVASEAGGVLQVGVHAPAGTYLLRITKDGKLLQTLKLQKK